MIQNATKRNYCQGITLISLVITIILLIILAGVVIKISLSEKGLFNTAKESKNQYVNMMGYEQTKILELVNKVDEIADNSDEQNLKKGKLSEIIDSIDYGKTINYSANGVNDWKVFYNDGTNVYIITSGLVNTSLIPNDIGIGKYDKYGVYCENVSNNKKAVEIFTNTDNWKVFATGKGAKEAYRRSNFRYASK